MIERHEDAVPTADVLGQPRATFVEADRFDLERRV
jgi:hypothetical protein